MPDLVPTDPTKRGKNGLQGQCKPADELTSDAASRLRAHWASGLPFAALKCSINDQLAVVTHASAAARAHFEAMVAVERPMLKPADAAHALNCDLRTIARLYEARELRGIELNATGGELRLMRRIERWSVCSLLMRKANYTVEDHLVCVVRFINALTEPERAVVHASVNWTDAKKSGGKS